MVANCIANGKKNKITSLSFYNSTINTGPDLFAIQHQKTEEDKGEEVEEVVTSSSQSVP